MDNLEKLIKQKGIDYGEPITFFSQLSQMWSAMIGKQLSTNQVVAMFLVMKALRGFNNPDHLDSFLDAQGYSKIAFDIAKILNEDFYKNEK